MQSARTRCITVSVCVRTSSGYLTSHEPSRLVQPYGPAAFASGVYRLCSVSSPVNNFRTKSASIGPAPAETAVTAVIVPAIEWYKTED